MDAEVKMNGGLLGFNAYFCRCFGSFASGRTECFLNCVCKLAVTEYGGRLYARIVAQASSFEV